MIEENQATSTDKYQNAKINELIEVENTYWYELYKSLERLKKNRDFKKLILEGYFKDKAVNGVSLLASQHTIRNGYRADVIEKLIAISCLQDYFLLIEHRAVQPEDISKDVEPEDK